jgi:hypothetical protein
MTTPEPVPSAIAQQGEGGLHREQGQITEEVRIRAYRGRVG